MSAQTVFAPVEAVHRDDYWVIGWNSDIVDPIDRDHDWVHLILATDD